MRTDVNNNPTAFTTDIAIDAGLLLGVDYVAGDPFFDAQNRKYFTAKLLHDPVILTARVIDVIGFQTHAGNVRWTYINFPHSVWLALTPDQKRDVIGWMYQHEGGELLKSLFPNYGEN